MDLATSEVNWVQTYTGRRVDPFNPRIQDINIHDIAAGLSKICRFNGQCLEFYSVAQHSVILSHCVPNSLAMYALLHDAEEAYLGDFQRPLKHLACYREIKEAGAHLQDVINNRFRLYPTDEDRVLIKKFDSALLATEAQQLMLTIDGWYLPEAPLGVTIKPVDHIEARIVFTHRFTELVAERFMADNKMAFEAP